MPLPDLTGRFRDCTPEFYRFEYNFIYLHSKLAYYILVVYFVLVVYILVVYFVGKTRLKHIG